MDSDSTNDRHKRATEIVRVFEAWCVQWGEWPDDRQDEPIESVILMTIGLYMEWAEELLGDTPLQVVVADMTPRVPMAGGNADAVKTYTVRHMRERLSALAAAIKVQHLSRGRGPSSARVQRRPDRVG